MRTINLVILPGDGIGPEIMEVAKKILNKLKKIGFFDLRIEEALVGGASIKDSGVPITEKTMNLAIKADAILFGAVGDYSFDGLPHHLRPEAAILGLRKNLSLFANLRPVIVFNELLDNSSLKPEFLNGLDLMIIRELTGDIYFGEPRGIKIIENGEKVGFNTMTYSESEIKRIAKVGFEIARSRNKHLTSVDKANVLETMQLWRDVIEVVSKDFADVNLDHLYVDNAAMQLVKNPKQFDVILTGNIFGDILSDQASMLSGSIGMLPSASMSFNNKGLFEPIHGSAPDIAGKNIANPIAMVLSVAMMLRYSFKLESAAEKIELAVKNVLAKKCSTGDIHKKGWKILSTSEMGNMIEKEMEQLC